jgi:hypothetical protein
MSDEMSRRLRHSRLHQSLFMASISAVWTQLSNVKEKNNNCEIAMRE